MALKLVAKKEDVPEAHRASAIETKDGQFAFSEDEDTTGLKNSVGAARKERDDAIAAKAAAEAKVAENQRQIDALRASTGDVDKKISDLLKKWETDTAAAVEAAVKAERDKAAPLAAFREKRLVDDELRKAFRAAEGREDLEDDAISLTRGEFKLVDDKLVNVGPDGQVTTVAPEQFYKNWKTKRGVFFKGTQADGGGAPGGQAPPAAGLAGKSPTQWTSEERAGFVAEHGSEAYTKLLEQQVRNDATAAATKKAAA